MTYFWNGFLLGLGFGTGLAIIALIRLIAKGIERNFGTGYRSLHDWSQQVIEQCLKQDRWRFWRADWWRPYHRRSWWL